jgi:ATP-dependent RNA helicase DHX57
MPEEFLGLCLEPPSFSHIKAAVKALLDIKAILPHPQLPLTPLGVHLAKMPVDCRIGKMLITSCLLGCLEPSLTIAAALGGKSPFVSPMNAREESRNAHKTFVANDKFSDHLAIVNAFDAWVKIRNTQGKGAAFAFCNQRFLSMTVLEEILLLRRDFKSYLVDAGFLDEKGVKRLFEANDENDGDSDDDVDNNTNSQNLSLHLQHQLMRCTLFAGLYPQMGRVTQYTDKDHPRGKGRQDLLPTHILQMDGTEVFIHPSSLNSNKLNTLMETKNGKAREAYIVYNKLVASGVSNTKVTPNDKSNASSPANTGRPYLFDCTSVPLPGKANY